MSKRYYWLKLPDDFFRQKAIKKLRKIAGGDTYTVIYLKMLLTAIKQDGKLYFEDIEDDFYEELALDLDEDADNIRVTVQFLLAQGLMQKDSEAEYTLPECREMTGSECTSAERVRAHRERKALQCNTDVTACNTEKQNGNVEIDKEINKEIDKEIDTRYETQGLDSAAPITAEQPVNCRGSVKRVIKAWNALTANGIQPVSSVHPGSKRYENLTARIRQHGEDKVLEAIERIKTSQFLCGINGRGWSATFDWFVLPNNFLKVIDGNYDDRNPKYQHKEDKLDGIREWYDSGETGACSSDVGSQDSVPAEQFPWL